MTHQDHLGYSIDSAWKLTSPLVYKKKSLFIKFSFVLRSLLWWPLLCQQWNIDLSFSRYILIYFWYLSCRLTSQWPVIQTDKQVPRLAAVRNTKYSQEILSGILRSLESGLCLAIWESGSRGARESWSLGVLEPGSLGVWALSGSTLQLVGLWHSGVIGISKVSLFFDSLHSIHA